MIKAVLVTLTKGSANKVYRVIYASGRDVLILDNELPGTVHKFLNAHCTTARTVRTPCLDNGNISCNYYVMYTAN